MKNKILTIGIILVLIIMLITLTGCLNNNIVAENNNEIIENNIITETESVSENKTNIIGTWKAVKTDNRLYALDYIYGSMVRQVNELTFKEDGTYVLGLSAVFYQDGKYEIDGNKIKLIAPVHKGDNPDGVVTNELEIREENGKARIILKDKCENIDIEIIFKNINDYSAEEESTKETEKISVGEFTLEYGIYKNTYIPEFGTYTLKKDGTFVYESKDEGTVTGRYTVKEETYQNSFDMFTDWLIRFESENKDVDNANQSWIVDGNNQFSGVQSGGIYKLMKVIE